MLEKIEKIFKEEKSFKYRRFKRKVKYWISKRVCWISKNVEKLERKLVVTQLPNEKFLYVKRSIRNWRCH